MHAGKVLQQPTQLFLELFLQRAHRLGDHIVHTTTTTTVFHRFDQLVEVVESLVHIPARVLPQRLLLRVESTQLLQATFVDFATSEFGDFVGVHNLLIVLLQELIVLGEQR